MPKSVEDTRRLCRKIQNLCDQSNTYIHGDKDIDVVRPVSTSYGYRSIVNELVDSVSEYCDWDLGHFKFNYPFIRSTDVNQFFLSEFFRKNHKEVGLANETYGDIIVPTNLELLAELYDNFDDETQQHIELTSHRTSFLYNYTFRYRNGVYTYVAPVSRFKLRKCKGRDEFYKAVKSEHKKFVDNITMFAKTLYTFRDDQYIMYRYCPEQTTSSWLKRVNMFLNKYTMSTYGSVSELLNKNMFTVDYDTRELTAIDYDKSAADKFRTTVRNLGLKIRKSPVSFTFSGVALKLYQTKNHDEIVINATMNKPVDFSSADMEFDCIYVVLEKLGRVDDFIGKLEPHALMGI